MMKNFARMLTAMIIMIVASIATAGCSSEPGLVDTLGYVHVGQVHEASSLGSEYFYWNSSQGGWPAGYTGTWDTTYDTGFAISGGPTPTGDICVIEDVIGKTGKYTSMWVQPYPYNNYYEWYYGGETRVVNGVDQYPRELVIQCARQSQFTQPSNSVFMGYIGTYSATFESFRSNGGGGTTGCISNLPCTGPAMGGTAGTGESGNVYPGYATESGQVCFLGAVVGDFTASNGTESMSTMINYSNTLFVQGIPASTGYGPITGVQSNCFQAYDYQGSRTLVPFSMAVDYEQIAAAGSTGTMPPYHQDLCGLIELVSPLASPSDEIGIWNGDTNVFVFAEGNSNGGAMACIPFAN